ncbi:hypothetical protein [Alkalihalobacterium chitinilyticum]|uniref:Tail assembly chaperone n=1 Tax=Alkalihalobacterium chitinilyticum TaxID=2980103 RepID=A0ABT5VJ45_9BACI|nr:hypothetical protein [Alkalihalobacterium chitinilyticum]MDE5415481.1 hypothetical protein [Alkalihalobacterium chitinilyticum]
MAKVYKDFDEFFLAKDDTMTVKLFGNEYDIPTSLSAKLALSMSKQVKEDPSQEMQVDQVIEFLNLIYGQENIEDWLDNGISITQLTDVLTWTMQQYSQAKVNVPAQKKRKAPVKKQ